MSQIRQKQLARTPLAALIAGLCLSACGPRTHQDAPDLRPAVANGKMDRTIPAPAAEGSPDDAVNDMPAANAPTDEDTTGATTIAPAQADSSYSGALRTQLAELANNHYRTQDSGFDARRAVGYSLPNVYCAEGVDCHDRYVMLTFSSSEESDMCSGVMLSPDLVLTNRHCIAVVTTKPNGSFGDWTVVITLPGKKDGKQGAQRVNAFASNLVAISPEGFETSYGAADWAILKLKTPVKAAVAFPKLNRDGILDGQDYHIYAKSAYADAKEPDAIEKRTCRARYRSIFAPHFDRPKQAVLSFTDCLIGPGNSGAPIYNEREEVVGIIGGQMNLNLLEALSGLATNDFHLAGQPFGYVGWGVNLACVPDVDHPATEVPADCDKNFGKIPGGLEIPEALATSAIKTLDAQQVNTGKFEFESRLLPPVPSALVFISQDLFARVPRCVRADARASLADADLSLDIPVTGVALTNLGTLTDRLAPVTRVKVKLVTKLDDLRAGRKVPSKLTLGESDLALMNLDLGTCGE